MNTSEVLHKAADLIEKRGWAIGGGWPEPSDPADAPLCLEGGIMAALGLSGYNAFTDSELASFESCPAYVAVAEHLEFSMSLFWWNDNRDRTASEVIEVLRATALIESARERQSTEVSA